MGETDVTVAHYNRERRRSSFARPMRDQEEILETLRNLKAQNSGKGELSRTMSLSGEKRRPNRKCPAFRFLSLYLTCTTYICVSHIYISPFLLNIYISKCPVFLSDCVHTTAVSLNVHPSSVSQKTGKRSGVLTVHLTHTEPLCFASHITSCATE